LSLYVLCLEFMVLETRESLYSYLVVGAVLLYIIRRQVVEQFAASCVRPVVDVLTG